MYIKSLLIGENRVGFRGDNRNSILDLDIRRKSSRTGKTYRKEVVFIGLHIDYLGVQLEGKINSVSNETELEMSRKSIFDLLQSYNYFCSEITL